ASLGGMAATRASGTNAVRYGTMRENVLALTVVLADGKVIRTAQRARKSAAGYDLTRLFVGSEGTLGIITEVTVRLYGIPDPISRLAECIAETKQDLAQSTIPSALAGHVGDGNFHLIFMIDPEKPEEIAEASRLNDRMVARALAMEGTCTGEHGIGYGKMDFLVAEHGPAIEVMRSIKQALDPNGIMNPGKIVRI